MGQDRVRKAYFEVWTAVGLAGLAVFPYRGTGLVLLSTSPRRPLQPVLLHFFELANAYESNREVA